MQREKLYNPHSKAYFNCVVSVSKESKTVVTSFRSYETRIFFYTDVKFDFSYFIFLSPNIIS